MGFQGRGQRVTGQEMEWTWPWSALAAPGPCGVVVPRGSRGGRRGRKKEPKALDSPQETGGSSALLLPPAQAPSSWSCGLLAALYEPAASFSSSGTVLVSGAAGDRRK